MTAAIIPLGGLHGHGLQAFRAACEIVDSHIKAGRDERSEALLRDVRRLLGYANDVFPLDREVADSFGARAANRLAAAIRLQDRK